ncbi:MAG: hypothetical protein EBY41_04720, partial [Proteobacteria bacterium]|nr:hypothetical protein [Pseudomonadota bacterium]
PPPPSYDGDDGDWDGGSFGDPNCDPADASEGGSCDAGDDSIICSALYHKGMLPQHIYEADNRYGKKIDKEIPGLVYGYQAWAQIVVNWMTRSEDQINVLPFITNKEKRFDIMERWSTDWASKIAHSWAQEMAYQMGAEEKGSLTGRMLMKVGYPLSKLCGLIKKKSTRKAGFFTGWSMIALLAFFRVLVLVCNEKVVLNTDDKLEHQNG